MDELTNLQMHELGEHVYIYRIHTAQHKINLHGCMSSHLPPSVCNFVPAGVAFDTKVK